MIHGIANLMELIAAAPARRQANFDTEWTILAGLAAVLALWMLTSYLVSRRRQREFWCNSSSRLFYDLCRAHRVDRANRRLIQKLAASRGVDNPADLFVEPENFNAKDLPAALKPTANELRQLRHELFE